MEEVVLRGCSPEEEDHFVEEGIFSIRRGLFSGRRRIFLCGGSWRGRLSFQISVRRLWRLAAGASGETALPIGPKLDRTTINFRFLMSS